jgi:hypothetical protein
MHMSNVFVVNGADAVLSLAERNDAHPLLHEFRQKK